MWKCQMCDEKFKTEKELRTHQENCLMLEATEEYERGEKRCLTR